MIEKIKFKFAEYIVRHKFSRKQRVGKIFNKFFSESQKILVILPLNRDDVILDVVEIIRYLSIHKKEIYIIHTKSQFGYLPTDFEFASLIVSDSQKTKLGLPDNDLVKKIKKHIFDIVIDLNIDENIFAQAITNIPISNFGIGFVKKNSDYFYSFQIPSENNHENSYRNLLNSLRMF